MIEVYGTKFYLDDILLFWVIGIMAIVFLHVIHTIIGKVGFFTFIKVIVGIIIVPTVVGVLIFIFWFLVIGYLANKIDS
jgi:hypothetical protein